MPRSGFSVPRGTAGVRYDDLYARWERGNWVSTELDFEQDRVDWNERMTADQRRSALWIFSLFFHGEDAVAEQLTPYIEAVDDVHQRYFLITQQVDEARHAVFFKRFMHEVAGRGDGSLDGGLSATRQDLTWGHVRAFEMLDATAAALRSDPSPARLAQAFTMYHLLIEGAIAQPAQHVLDRALVELDVLPAFRRGLELVSNDEQRHIGFGVKVVADLLREDPEGIEGAIAELLDEVLPITAALACPPDWDHDYRRAVDYTAPLGFTLEDLYEVSAQSFEDRLRATGMRIDEIPRFPVPVDIPMRERGTRALKLVHAGFLGPDQEHARADGEALAIFFDETRRRADPSKAPPGTVFQWDFTDAEPWHIELQGDAAQAAAGRAPKPDITLRTSLQDWLDLASGRASAPRLMLRRRLRLRGRPRALRSFARVFA